LLAVRRLANSGEVASSKRFIGGKLRRLRPAARELHVSPLLSDGQRALQIATQLALPGYGDLIDTEIRGAGLIDEQSSRWPGSAWRTTSPARG
jgi:predicted transcriptional regulator